MEPSVSAHRFGEGRLSLVIPAGGGTSNDKVVGFDQEADEPEEVEDMNDDNSFHEVGALEVSERPLLVL